jgi:hypothetical protein
MRALLFILLCMSSASLAQSRGKPIAPEKLSEFLGPVSSKAFTWTRLDGPDFSVYYGHANSPLAGDVGLYIGGYPDFPPKAASKIVSGKLGIFSVEWYRAVSSDGSVEQHSVIKLNECAKAHIWVSANQQSDVERLLEVVAQLPIFTTKPKPLE